MSEQVNIITSIIICPNCAAQFQVAPEVIGKSGRKVKCANCQKDWRATIAPVSDKASGLSDAVKLDSQVDKTAENAMDAAFQTAEKETRSLARPEKKELPQRKEHAGNSANAKTLIQQRADMARRKIMLNRAMPRARMRRVVRISGAVVLVSIVLFSLIMRENIVRNFPDLAGIYSAVGLETNVVGLEFSEVKTLTSLENGVEMLDISADIISVSGGDVLVPKVIISLLDGYGNSLFDWSVTPRVAIMMRGEVIELKTQLSAPPVGTRSVRLMFESSK